MQSHTNEVIDDHNHRYWFKLAHTCMIEDRYIEYTQVQALSFEYGVSLLIFIDQSFTNLYKETF